MDGFYQILTAINEVTLGKYDGLQVIGLNISVKLYTRHQQFTCKDQTKLR